MKIRWIQTDYCLDFFSSIKEVDIDGKECWRTLQYLSDNGNEYNDNEWINVSIIRR